MTTIIPMLITLIAIAVVVVLINKKFNPVLLFFSLGILLQLYLVFFMGQSPLGEDTTGNSIVDIFAFITQIFKNQLNGVGSNIMLVAGYAALMNAIGASAKLADVMMKPLLKFNRPYIVVAGLFLIGVALKLMITSHAAHGLLLMTVFFPILIRLGVSPVSAASVIILSGTIDWGPNNSVVLHAAETVSNVPVGEFFINYQFVPGLVTAIAMAIVIAIYFNYMDGKDKQSLDRTSPFDVESQDEKGRELAEKISHLPAYYSILPAVPLFLIILFTFIPNVKMDVFTANIIGIMVTLIIEAINLKEDKIKGISDHLSTVWKQMGSSFSGTVVLIVAASFFADGLLSLGGIEILADALAGFESAGFITMFVLSLLILLTVVALGSGVASWFAFGPLLGDISSQIGLETYKLAVPIQMASGLGRGISPVAAAGISVAGIAGVDIADTIKRSALPLIVGWFVSVVISYIYL